MEHVAQALEELLGARRISAGQEHREAPASDTAGDVVPAGRLSEPSGDLGEHSIRSEVAEPSVERRQPVDVEHQERERVRAEASPPDLALEQRLERTPVVELGQRIELRDRIRLAQCERRLECRPGAGHDVLERGDVGIAELAVG
jgi:hypothetical protein